MDISTYAIEHEVEQNHWWFVGRRFLFKDLIERLNLSKGAAILDVGSSSGTNLRLLKEMGFTNYQGLDISLEAKQFCEAKGLGTVMISDIQQQDLTPNAYDLILITDVLEHLQDDKGVINRLHTGLKAGGYVLITVPCFEKLWGPQDIVSHHLRRYTKAQILDHIGQSRFQIIRSFYFNYLLFLPIWIARTLLLKAKRIQNENQINAPLLNRILKAIFRFDCWSAQWLSPPFGVSALVIARKM